MKKLSFIIALLLVINITGFAQETKNEYDSYKIVFQLSNADTNSHKALMKQINNIKSTSPGTQIQVICHGPGLLFLQKNKTVVEQQINNAKAKGVEFAACEFSLKERKVSKEEILPSAKYVKAGILEIVKLQSEGWYYIKSGF
jgi:intracellular sulfur oxidation DsrE/DsrF family protein